MVVGYYHFPSSGALAGRYSVMAGFQFLHIESYSDARPKARTKSGKVASGYRWSAADALDEATRTPGACPHVAEPLEPTWLVGDREAVEQAGREWREGTRTAAGRAVRSDALWCGALVASMPRDRLADWPAYRDAVIEWARLEYGDRVRGVIEHLDEQHPHVHVYLVPRPGEEIGAVHAGQRAKTAARRAGDTHVSTAYKDAMSAFQDDFFAAVGWEHGLTRLGPKRQRVTRAEWLQQQAEAAVAATEASAEAARQQAEAALQRAAAAEEREKAALQRAEAAEAAARDALQRADLTTEQAEHTAAKVLAEAADDAAGVREQASTEVMSARKRAVAWIRRNRDKLKTERDSTRTEVGELKQLAGVYVGKMARAHAVLGPAIEAQRADLDAAKRALEKGDQDAARAAIKAAEERRVPQIERPPTTTTLAQSVRPRPRP